uniref:Uncharacterized protein n=1 Tax=Romanomermis culicivorax TaxID=13658 RepID=A0A915IJ57_ROMCU
MLVRDAIERESKKSNAVLFGLAEDNQDDLESVRQIVTDFGPELTENDTAITADDTRQRQRELVAQLNARKQSGETGLYIDFRHNCI